jgi:hypothetical protein
MRKNFKNLIFCISIIFTCLSVIACKEKTNVQESTDPTPNNPAPTEPAPTEPTPTNPTPTNPTPTNPTPTNPTPPKPLTQCINPTNKIEANQVHQNENFENLSINGPCSWQPDALINEGPFTEAGEYFTQQEITPAEGYRSSLAFGENNWLTAELYSRDKDRAITDFINFIDDPSGNENTVLKLSTLKHTDGAIIRSSQALPKNYRMSLKVGFPQYGDGEPGLNGYDSGDELAEPWNGHSATAGFQGVRLLDFRFQGVRLLRFQGVRLRFQGVRLLDI